LAHQHGSVEKAVAQLNGPGNLRHGRLVDIFAAQQRRRAAFTAFVSELVHATTPGPKSDARHGHPIAQHDVVRQRALRIPVPLPAVDAHVELHGGQRRLQFQ
jgi:hypothetical protein